MDIDKRPSNLKPAPFGMTSSVVANVIGAARRLVKGMTHVPVSPEALVDQPTPSANPENVSDNAAKIKAERLKAMRAALRKGIAAERHLQAEEHAEAAKQRPRITLGYRNDGPKAPLPAQPFEQRRAQLQKAILHLRAHGVLVTVHERAASIRRYHVTGKSTLQLTEDVIALAVSMGMGA